MAKVIAQVVGGTVKPDVEAETVADVKRLMDAGTYTATVNGEPATDSHTLRDYDFVSLAPAVKGA